MNQAGGWAFIVHPSSFIVVSFRLLHHFDQMRDLGNHAAHMRRIETLGHPVHLAQSERLAGLAHFARTADAAAHLAHADRLLVVGLLLRAHAAPSSSVPRSAWYCFSLRSC